MLRLQVLVGDNLIGDSLQFQDMAPLMRRGPDRWRLDSTIASGDAVPEFDADPLNTDRFLPGIDQTSMQAPTVPAHD